MSLKIEIVLPDGEVEPSVLAKHMKALGYYTAPRIVPMPDSAASSAPSYVAQAESTAPAESEATPQATRATPEAPKRERGKPSPGKARRTKEEIAEDEAADAAVTASSGDVYKDVNAERPAISTGESRVGPEDDPETEKQDAADEAAETAGAELPPIEMLRKKVGEYRAKFGMPAAAKLFADKGMVDMSDDEIVVMLKRLDAELNGGPAPTEEPAKPATKEDVMKAMLAYALKFDRQNTDMNAMPKTMADMPKVFAELFGAGVEKLSQIPADGYGRAVAAINSAMASDKFGRA